MTEGTMPATTATKTRRPKTVPKVRFLIALPPPLFRQIEKRAFAKKQRIGKPWFRNDEVIDLLHKGLGESPPTV